MGDRGGSDMHAHRIHIRFRAIVLAVATMAVLFSACGSDSDSSTQSSDTTEAAATPATNAAPVSGSLTVFAAASLTAAFNNAKTPLTAANPGLTITYNFA